MTIDVTLDVFLKGVDLVANTAFLTLRSKMGYSAKLLGLKRLESYAFTIDTPDPAGTAALLKRVLATQSTFYNRNKHYFVLHCRWDGGELRDGAAPEERRRRVEAQARATLTEMAAGSAGKDFDSQGSTNRVILEGVPAYRTEVLVEGIDPTARNTIARKLESELSVAPVEVTALGTCWHLALRAETESDARAITEEISVTVKRDRGLLLNPNYEGFRFLAIEKIDLTD